MDKTDFEADMTSTKPDIISVMESEGIELRQRGRDYWGCCPFHGDKSPSFKVNVERQSFYCFGCGEHGDSIDFIMKRHDIDFKTALRQLGIRRGRLAPIDPEKIRQRELKRAFETWRQTYYSELCRESVELHALRGGFAGRQISDENAWTLAKLLAQLPEIEYKLDILFGRDEELLQELHAENVRNCAQKGVFVDGH